MVVYMWSWKKFWGGIYDEVDEWWEDKFSYWGMIGR